MAEHIEKSLLEVDFASLTRRTVVPSPAAWEDQVLYFLLLDRFPDGNETEVRKVCHESPVAQRRFQQPEMHAAGIGE
jgi:hypothetical protein